MENEGVGPETLVESTEKSFSHADEPLTFAAAEIPPDISDAPRDELSINNAEHGLEDPSASSSSSRRHSETEGYLDDGMEDGKISAKSASSRSSLSSIPDSVVVHPKEQSFYARDSLGTRESIGTRDSIGEIQEEQEYMNYSNPVYQKIRDRNSPFRHPSSVKAIQMQTEDEEDEDYMSPSRRRGAAFRGSPVSVRSLGSPLIRRQGYHSAGGTPKKSSIKKENPLVLLHCTILPPTVNLAPDLSLPDRKILEKVLPAQYWRRWKLLEEKIISSGLLRDRGLLLQHPQEDYGLLEERFLESLELQKPRLENGHYISHEASDSENESTVDMPKDSNHVDERSCADCGCHINHRDDRRKWDVKFYAANGLMKEGAWTAAWKEIERVDVQVSLWLPYEVKTEVEKRIQEENLLLAEQAEVKIAQQVMNVSELKKQENFSQDQIDGLDDELEEKQKNTVKRETSERAPPTFERTEARKTNQDADLHTLLINSIRVLISDRRNVITAFSMVIAVFALVFGGGRSSRRPYFGSDLVQFGDFPAVSTQVSYTSSSSVLTQIPTEIPLSQTESGMERPSAVQRVAEGVRPESSASPSVELAMPSVEPEAEPVIETSERDLTENPASEAQVESVESVEIEKTAIETTIESDGVDKQQTSTVSDVVNSTPSPESNEHPEDNDQIPEDTDPNPPAQEEVIEAV